MKNNRQWEGMRMNIKKAIENIDYCVVVWVVAHWKNINTIKQKPVFYESFFLFARITFEYYDKFPGKLCRKSERENVKLLVEKQGVFGAGGEGELSREECCFAM